MGLQWVDQKKDEVGEKQKGEETTICESYFSKSPSSKPAFLANTISKSLTAEYTPLKTQTHSGYGNKGNGLWEPESRFMVDVSLNLKK